MYTMLMMMAVSTGGETASFGGRNKGGCTGESAGCGGYVATAPAGCDGNGGGRRGFLGGLCNKKDSGGCTGVVASCNGIAVAPAYTGCTGAVVVDSGSCNGGCGGKERGGFLRGHFAKKRGGNGCDGGSGCSGGAVSYGCVGSTVGYAPVAGCVGGSVAPAPMVAMPAAPAPMPATPMPVK